jgi:hypothetical protein
MKAQPYQEVEEDGMKAPRVVPNATAQRSQLKECCQLRTKTPGGKATTLLSIICAE